MAKIIIHDIPLKQAANILAQTGITLDTHQLPDGTYRAYVRKDKMPLFLSLSGECCSQPIRQG